LLAAGLSAAAFALYAATLLPGLGSGDTAEFQRVLPTLDVAHPTGYPLYTLLGWLWSWLPLGTMAWRISLLSAAAAALAIGALFGVARAIGQSAPVAAGAALALAATRTFWSQATIAEVYALAALIQALLLLALLRWRAGRWPLWVAGLLAGLGLAHHRTIILMFPGALVFVLVTLWQGRAAPRTSPLWRELALAIGALVAGCLFYLYLPLRAPAWLDSWRTLLRVIAGSDALGVWLGVNEPWRVAAEHLRELWASFILPQFSPLGVALALLGLARVARRDRALAALLGLGYLATLVFCVLFFVQDVEVFLLSGHVIMALLVGEGAMLLVEMASRAAKRSSFAPLAGTALLALPAFLFAQNVAPIRAANSTLPERAARATLAQDLPPGSLLLADWDAVEPLRYLQAIEGVRPDVEVRTLNEDVARQDVDAALGAGRAAFLLRALPNLGLSQSPAGRLWRVSAAPPQLAIATPSDTRWADGLALSGFTLPPGPYRPGEIVPLTLGWAAWQRPAQEYTLFVHLIGPDGAVWGQFDRAPAPPTSQWQPGALQPGLYGPTLRLDAPPGRYRVLLGWYSYPSLERLALQSGGDAFELGTVKVAPLADLPAQARPQ
jgi:hypothetical protein